MLGALTDVVAEVDQLREVLDGIMRRIFSEQLLLLYHSLDCDVPRLRH